MYQVLIADDHPLFREAIARVIDDGFPGSTLLEASDLDSALAVAGRHDDLDLVLLDLNMPGMQGLGGLVRLRNLFPTLPAVIVSAEEEKRVILQTITYGAVGFITKSTPRKQMIQALEQVLAGSIYLPADIIRAGSGAGEESTAARREPEDLSDVLATLTRKQLQVFERMSRGDSNKVIAYQLNIAESTVKAHVSAILRKLGATNRVQAILSAGDIDFAAYLRAPKVPER
ncbi:MAG TPA: DNA-binding response regulator [Alcanivorax sp.]|jgi:DNA-binding NarL/FixJ family response regulator|uniref:DNA-binding response regulator AgmR n=1 Tax=Alloalcanivorax venustensis ISO4 TaxID=1177184 RepID=A0ABS0AGH1_9GAMM|nr:response regulator transcription factor [Alloalcanivorax venustensis]KXJ48190.1 MAG: LuxR family transcriptional regulator [Alcanivorax sp. Nap_24]SMO55056.1 two component transcriptional regulator, LuxR family [Alcanivorax sp. DSM 26295]HAB09639.1 DNA-binding response regulator [Alcanivorax sp.]MBF5052702.1 DNA-binding response regulator AgmR [Alloalcanivorax venustensis ISO4]HAI25394.1 DNA-binding response regulator [Alcanivorax sp.]|tara:strand:- start:7007 stop:7696 length:690 start_codon:yes stop_codon:yes gene_type:complete